MKRAFFKWLIGWCADSGRALPSWLSRHIDRDAKLQQYAAEFVRLEGQLRRDASTWTLADAPLHDKTSVNSTLQDSSSPARTWDVATLAKHNRSITLGSRRLGRLTAAVAVGLLLTAGVFWQNHRGDFPEQPTVAPSSGKAPLPRGAQITLTVQQREWMRELLTNDWREQWKRSGLDGRQLLQSVDDIGAQPKALAADLERAVAFFARDLPVSTARVIGLASAAPSDVQRLSPESTP